MSAFSFEVGNFPKPDTKPRLRAATIMTSWQLIIGREAIIGYQGQFARCQAITSDVGASNEFDGSDFHTVINLNSGF